MLKRILSAFLVAGLALELPLSAYAAATPSESWTVTPGSAPISVYSLKKSNVQRMDDLEVSDLFSGGSKYSYAFDFPKGTHGIVPGLSLDYSSLNRDAQSAYGYGWNLSVSSVTRTGRYGPEKAYEVDELLVDGREFVEVGGSYKPRVASDDSKLEPSGGGWLLTDGTGVRKYFWLSAPARSSSEDGSKTYQWMLERIEYPAGEKVSYSYSSKDGVCYPSSVEYGFSMEGVPLYRLAFSYSARTSSMESFRSGFPVRATEILSEIALSSEGNAFRKYRFAYDSLDTAFPHLLSVTERTASGFSAPPVSFSYGSGKYSHLLTQLKLPTGGEIEYSYSPTTSMKTDSGSAANPRMPLVNMNLSRARFYDPVTRSSWSRSFSYEGGKFYFDANDPFRREFVGFGKVVTVEADGSKRVDYFHQGTFGSSVDTLPKKGYPYRNETYSASGALVTLAVSKYSQKPLDSGRVLVKPESAVSFEFGNGKVSAKAVSYQYDVLGNPVRVDDYGSVTADPATGNFADTGSDLVVTEVAYAADAAWKTLPLPATKKTNSQDGTELAYERTEYDGQPFGSVWTKMLVTASEKKDVKTGSFVRQSFEYWSSGSMTKSVDELGNATEYSSDQYGVYFTKVRNAKGFETAYSYDYSAGAVSSVADPNGITKTLSFDAFGRPSSESATSSSGDQVVMKTWSYVDDQVPRSATQVESSASGTRTTVSYLDGFSRPVQTKTSGFSPGEFWTADVAYDERGLVKFAGYPYSSTGSSFSTGSVSYGKTMAYDVLGRAVSATDADGASTVQYEPGAQVSTDKLGYKKKFSYDARGNLAEVRELYGTPQEAATTYSYSPLGQLVRYRDALGNVRNVEYDGFWRVSKLEDLHKESEPDVPYETYSYDVAWRLVRSVDQLGNVETDAYDELGRPISKSFSKPDGSADRTFAFAYDSGAYAVGQLTGESWSAYSRSYSYDAFGRKASESAAITLGSSSKRFDTGFSYAPTGELVSLSYPDGYSVSYGYSNGYLESVRENSGSELARIVAYSPSGKPSAFAFGEGLSETRSFDPAHGYRLSGKKDFTASWISLQDLSYSYDAENRIIALAEAAPTQANRNVSYSYDGLWRLSGADYGSGTVQSFSYDPLGNVVSGPLGQAYAYSASAFLGNPHALLSAGNLAFQYDRQGNLIGRDETAGSGTVSTAFRYDAANRLENVRGQDGKADFSYSYDSSNIRLSKRDFEENSVTLYPNDYYETEFDKDTSSGSSTIATTVDRHVYFAGLRFATKESKTVEPIVPAPVQPETPPVGTGSASSGSGIQDGSGSTDSVSAVPPSDTVSASPESSGSTVPDSGSGTAPDAGTGTSVPTGSGATDPATVSGSAMAIPAPRIASDVQSGSSVPSDRLVFHLTDHLGSATLDVDRNGNVLSLKDYFPYGTERVSVADASGYRNRYSFGNKELDSESGLSYFENRYYSAPVGRFTQRDPVFRELGRTKRAVDLLSDPQQWNSYSYARNNPVVFTDPRGEAIETFFDVGMTVYDAWNLYYSSAKVASDLVIFKYAELKWDEYLMDAVAAKVDDHVQSFKDSWTDVAADAVAAAVPFVPAWGTKVARYAGKVREARRLERAAKANTLHHIFDKAEHNLGVLVDRFGSQEKAFDAVQAAANKALKEGKLNISNKWVLPSKWSNLNQLDVWGIKVNLIGGKVENGKVNISSFSRKWID